MHVFLLFVLGLVFSYVLFDCLSRNDLVLCGVRHKNLNIRLAESGFGVIVKLVSDSVTNSIQLTNLIQDSDLMEPASVHFQL